MNLLERYQVAVFFVVTIAISSAIAAASAFSGDDGFAILSVFSPSLTAILLTALARGRPGLKALLVDQTFRRVDWRWLLASIIIVPAMAGLVAFVFAGTTQAPFSLATTSILPFAIVIFLIAIGEEFGWRAYATVELHKRYSVLTTGVIVGLAWAAWHFPAALIGTGVPLETPFWLFGIWVIGAALLMGWIYANTQSVVPAILFHAAANAAFIYLPLLPEHTGSIWPFTGLIAMVWVLVCIVYGANGTLRLPGKPR